MGAKQALIVDDSKSARLFLARILERYEIRVDSAESAEAAIEYLANNRPDVIFMDHLMPGMDGFQAVQAIKNNPRTATIPIMMYTSQEGELYLGQARALGAVGVLPKQIKQTDVSKVLYQLHLVPERRTDEQQTFRAVNAPSGAETPLEEQLIPGLEISGSKPLTDTALREHFAELRRALVAGIDTQTDRITAEVRALLMEALPRARSSDGAAAPERPGRQWGWIVASAALAIALAGTGLWWRNEVELHAVTAELAQLRSALEERPRAAPAIREPVAQEPAVQQPLAMGQPQPAPETANGPRDELAAAPAPAAAQKTPAPAERKPLILSVPYGADALGGPRLESIRQLLHRLVKESLAGVVEIKAFAGRFCLMGNSTDGFSIAPDETPFAKCDLVGNPADEALSPAQRTPLALANLIGEIRGTSHGTLDVQPAIGDGAVTLVPYPAVSSDLTAGEWNRAGSANNRIEIRVR